MLANAPAIPTTGEFAMTGLLIAALVALALRGLRPANKRSRPAVRPRTAFLVALAVCIAYSLGPETWTGVATALASAGIGGVLLLRASRRPGWGTQHAAAVATAVLVTRGSLAFLYFPLVGEVSAGRKYTHNAVMLALVAGIGWYATRQATQDAAHGDPTTAPAPAARSHWRR